MKSPIDTVKGRIVGYDERTGDVLIRARYEDYFTLCKREYKSCLVQLVDSRPSLAGSARPATPCFGRYPITPAWGPILQKNG